MRHKILFIIHLPPPVHGAAMVGTFIKDSRLINSKFETDYINLATAGTLDQIGKAGSKKLFTFIKLLTTIIRALNKRQYDLCFMTLNATGVAFYKDILIVAILKLFRKKIIYQFHNKGIELNRKRKVNDMLYRFAFSNTQSILNSPYLYKDIEAYVKKENVYYLPNGIPACSENSDSKSNLVTDTYRCQLLFLSNMMYEKGVTVLIEACKILKEKKLAFECHFVGAWADVTEDEFKKQVLASNLSDIITSHGKKYGEEKTYFLQNADIFVFPTFYHNECFPLVLLEAMQFSLPIVSTFEGGIRDIVLDGKTGFLVPQKDVKMLAEKLEILIQHPQMRTTMGLAGMQRFNEHFTIQKFEEKATQIFDDTIIRRRA